MTPNCFRTRIHWNKHRAIILIIILLWRIRFSCHGEEEDKPQGFNMSINSKHYKYDCLRSVWGVFHKSEEFLGLVQKVISHNDSSAVLLKERDWEIERRETLQKSAKQLCQTALNPITNMTTWVSWFNTDTQRSHWSSISRAKRHIHCKTEQCFTTTHCLK